MFDKVRPTHVIHLAAKVGGLFANMQDKVGFFQKNMAINQNIICASHAHKVTRLICLLSTCIFPDNIDKYPMDESMLHMGAPHPSNEGYAQAKRMCEV